MGEVNCILIMLKGVGKAKCVVKVLFEALLHLLSIAILLINNVFTGPNPAFHASLRVRQNLHPLVV